MPVSRPDGRASPSSQGGQVGASCRRPFGNDRNPKATAVPSTPKDKSSRSVSSPPCCGHSRPYLPRPDRCHHGSAASVLVPRQPAVDHHGPVSSAGPQETAPSDAGGQRERRETANTIPVSKPAPKHTASDAPDRRGRIVPLRRSRPALDRQLAGPCVVRTRKTLSA